MSSPDESLAVGVPPPATPSRKRQRSDETECVEPEAHDAGEQDMLASLERWLRASNPHDVLIPCAVGEKRPMFPYRDGAWTWREYDTFVASSKTPVDWAIVLRHICVVDVDSPSVAKGLEARFPVLSAVPCETTARGLHYFFKRTPTADALGIWDGSAQVLESVDFKSVASTGTGGVILVSPSSEKTWLRAPWHTALLDIPEDVLLAVAKPVDARASPPVLPPLLPLVPTVEVLAKPSVSEQRAPSPAAAADADEPASVQSATTDELLRVSFDGDEADAAPLVVSGTRLAALRRFDYCAALLSGRWSVEHSAADEDEGAPALHLPCSRAAIEELLSLHASGTLTNARPPTCALLAEVDATADMLGAPRREKSPLLERATFWADLWQLCPTWWRNCSEEQAHMLGTSPEASDAALIRITHELAQIVGYQPLRKASDMWLFNELPHVLGQNGVDFKVLMDEPCDHLRAQLPPAVLAILGRHPTCVAAAGGAVLGGVSRFANHGSDVDLFLYGLDQDGSAGVLRDIEQLVGTDFEGVYEVTRSPAAVTFTKKREEPAPTGASPAEREIAFCRNRPFQIVLGLHRARSQILEYFDLSPCKVLARMDADADDDAMVVEALPIFLSSIRHMAFHVDIMYWSAASVARIAKYVAKGFECAVPGVRRGAFPDNQKIFLRQDHSGMWHGREICYYSHGKRGLSVLFDAEAEVLRSRAHWSKTPTQLRDAGEMMWPNRDGKLEPIVELITGRLSSVEAATIASKIASKLGNGYDASKERPPQRSYDSDDDEGYFEDGLYDFYGCKGARTGTYGYIRESFRCDVAVRLGDARRDIALNTKFWTFTEAGRFKPEGAGLAQLYAPEKLERIAEQEAAARAAAVRSPDGYGECEACGAACALLICEACGCVFYCDDACKARDADRHKAECEDLQREVMQDSSSEDGSCEDDKDEGGDAGDAAATGSESREEVGKGSDGGDESG